MQEAVHEFGSNPFEGCRGNLGGEIIRDEASHSGTEGLGASGGGFFTDDSKKSIRVSKLAPD